MGGDQLHNTFEQIGVVVTAAATQQQQLMERWCVSRLQRWLRWHNKLNKDLTVWSCVGGVSVRMVWTEVDSGDDGDSGNGSGLPVGGEGV